MENPRLTFLFHRYVNKSCSDQERQEFFDMVADADHDDEVKVLLSQLWDEYGDESFARSEEVYTGIFANAPRSRFPWLKLAASFLILALIGASLLFFRTAEDAAPGARRVAVKNAVPDFITLPDGSTVILNAGSRISYAKAFDGPRREVTLEGEGYFDIVHDASRPFIVHTGKLKTTVLGTAFNIRAYADQKEIIVTVTRGRVKVSDEEKTVGIINPNQQITFDRQRKAVQQRDVDSQRIASWVEKDIYFDDITLSEAAGQLERRFGARINVENTEIMACRFTATFVKGEDLEQIVRVLCEFNQATYAQDGAGTFRIVGGVCR